MQEIKLFLFVLSIVYSLRIIVEFSMKLTQERILLLKQLLNQAYSVNVISKDEDGRVTGTLVQITIPLYSNDENLSLIEEELNQ